MRNTTFFAASFFAATLSQLAWAGPAELPEEELFEYADVVADVEVVSLACDGDPYIASESFYQTRYVAELRVNGILKGEPGEMLTYRVTTREALDPNLEEDCSAPEYVLPEGWVGRVYLQAAGDLGYWIENPGGAMADVELSHAGQAPSCAIIAPSTTDPEHQDPDPHANPPGGTAASGTDADSEAASCSVSAPGSSSDGAWLGLALAGAAFAVSRRRGR